MSKPELHAAKIYDGAIHVKVRGRIRLWLVKRWAKHPKIVYVRSN